MMFSAPMNDTNSNSSSSSVLPDQTCQRFSLSEIQSATNSFDETLLIGRGGFGKVYKCPIEIGSARREVAVKRLHSMSNQGAPEFEAEVQILSKLRHGNLVSLLGYCNEENDMVLVYDFMPNGTLEDHLHKLDSCLSWLQLLKICVGAARGLDYLHTGTSTQHGVIHRDVKSSNILLDANLDAKISDFGLAKVGVIDHKRTHMSTAVKGTFGYMDPSYFYTGKLTRKSDVYAFGVVLFEVLSGKEAVDSTIDEEEWGLAGWALYQIKQGKLNQIIDQRLTGQISKKCLKEFASIAAHCLHTQPRKRPTMAEVVVKLESILLQERESATSVIDEEGFIYKLRSLFTSKVDASVSGAKSDLLEVDATIESKSVLSSHHKPSVDTTAIKNNANQSFRTFTYDELASATNGFKDKEYSPTSYEYIYKGWVDETTYEPTEYGVGLAMYVRKMWYLTQKPDIKPEDFNHPNLVKFLGYCFTKQELFCVYELISGITLDKYLYGGRTSLSWSARLKIATGAAEGLFHLHKRNKAVYSQFKTNLMLVDKDFNARLSDFSFETHTYQLDAYYAAPEWFRYKADVFDGLHPLRLPDDGFAMKNEIYAFGVVLLEILTGMKVYDTMRPNGKEKLVEWATPFLADEMNLGMIMDPQLRQNDCPPKGAFKVAQLISNCLQRKQDKRPSMSEIVQVLNHCYIKEVKTV